MKVSRFIISSFIVVMIVFCLTAISYAALVDNGDGTITDTDRNLMWLQNGNVNGQMSWGVAMNWADTLTYAGYDDWRLPSSLNSDSSGPCLGYNCTDSDMGHLFYTELVNTGYPTPGYGLSNVGPFTNLQADTYWSSTEYSPGSSNAWHFDFGNGYQDDYGGKDSFSLYAVAVRTVVPEPISSILFVTGGTLLAGRRYMKRKKKA